MSVLDEIKKITSLLTSTKAELSLSRRERLQARPKLREHPDPIPIALPVGMQSPPTMRELVQEYVAGAMSTYAAEQKLGTFEEEDDFEDVDDEMPPMSQFEVTEFPMPEENPTEDASPPEDLPSGSEPKAAAESPPETEPPGKNPRTI